MDVLDRPVREIGEEWERQMIQALRRRYQDGARLTVLKAAMGTGDGGIEAYSHDGLAFQCFADRDSLTLRHRTTKQKKKVLDDTLKLRKNEAILRLRLDGTRLKRWVLLVPEYHTAELVDHCSRRARTVRGWRLSILTSDFRIVVQEEDDYRSELAALHQLGLARLSIPTVEPDDASVDSLSSERPHLVQVLEEKLAVLPTSTSETRDQLIRAYLTKGQVMAGLEEWPETLEAVEEIRRMREKAVSLEGDLDPYDGRRIAQLARSYADELAEEVPALTKPQALDLSQGTIAEWLMRCPLKPLKT